MAHELTQLIIDLRDDDLYVRRRAASDLCLSPDRSAVPALLAALQDEDDYVREKSAEALGATGDSRAIPQLRAAAMDAHPGVRTAAIGALARQGDKNATVTLLEILRGGVRGEPGEAARYLGYTADPSLVPELLNLLWHASTHTGAHASSYTRAMLIEALGRLGDSRAIPWLMEQLASRERFYEPGVSYFSPPEISDIAGRALRAIGSREALHALETWQDQILSSVHYPKEVTPGTWTSLFLYVFRGKAADCVAADAVQQLNAKTGIFRRYIEQLSRQIPRDTMIKVHLKLNGIECNPCTAEFGFCEDWHRVSFRIRASRDLLYRASNGVIAITASGVIVAEVPVSIYVTDNVDDERTLAKSVCRAYHSVFCSYSHKDQQVVERIEIAYRALGFDYLRDVKALRSGERWDERLLQLINDADLFQLFWSAYSAQSLHVEKEWRYALSLGRENFIRPVRWVDPIDPTPPSELQDIHFAYTPELAAASRQLDA